MKAQKPKPITKSSPPGGSLAPTQQTAVDLIAEGKSDAEAAEVLRVSRGSVTRWRVHSPEFRAALSVRRAELWGAAQSRLQNLIPKALDTLADVFANAPLEDRCRLALDLLKLTGTRPATAGSADPDDYVREVVQRERGRLRAEREDLTDSLFGLPRYEAHFETVQERLAALAAADDRIETPIPRPSDEQVIRDDPQSGAVESV